MKPRNAIADLVGGVPYRHALFYNYPGGLRFELSTGGEPLDQVLAALRKATVICEDIFVGEDTMLVHLQKWAPSHRFALRTTLRELDLAGIAIPRGRDIWLEQTAACDADPDDDDGESWVNIAFELPTSKLQNLLWTAVVTDFADVRPNPHCQVYLINVGRQLVAHPYDDRGMDVIGAQAALGELYRRHGALLLDHDRAAMDRTFAQ